MITIIKNANGYLEITSTLNVPGYNTVGFSIKSATPGQPPIIINEGLRVPNGMQYQVGDILEVQCTVICDEVRGQHDISIKDIKLLDIEPVVFVPKVITMTERNILDNIEQRRVGNGEPGSYIVGLLLGNDTIYSYDSEENFNVATEEQESQFGGPEENILEYMFNTSEEAEAFTLAVQATQGYHVTRTLTDPKEVGHMVELAQAAAKSPLKMKP